MIRFDHYRRNILAALMGFGLATSPLAALAQTQPVGPALWVVRDEDSTIYLFGTIHFLRANMNWRTDEVQRAWEASDRLVLEVADPEDQAAVGPLIQQFGLSPDRPLSSLLGPDDLRRFTDAAAAMGADARRMDAMRPWLAGVVLSSAKLSRAGYDAGSGVDVILRAEAQAAGKPITGLETPEDQVRMLAGFPEAGQVAFLSNTIRDFDAAPVELERLAEAWVVGDTNAVAAITLQPMRDQSEQLYQTLIVERNQRWARQIQGLLESSGTSFVAVGALHLSGQDGVPEILKSSGVEAIRVPDVR